MKKKDLILEVSRNPKDNTSLDISIKANTFGFELYRVCLVLLDKMIEMGKASGDKEAEIDIFFEKLKENYKNFYKKD